jgi:hypothetical protein
VATAATAGEHARESLAALDEHAPMQAQRARRKARLGQRERLTAALLGGSFLAAAIPLAVLLPSDRHPASLAYVALIGSYAAAWRLDFEVGTGFSVPTQLLLVPMLFVLPLAAVPLCVAAAIVLANVVDGARRLRHIERTLAQAGNAWHVVGPVAVLAAAGGGARAIVRLGGDVATAVREYERARALNPSLPALRD